MSEFKTSSTWIVMYVISGVVFVIMGLAMPRYLFVGVGAVFCIVGGYLKMVPILWLRDDHLAMKIAPAAPKKLVLYKEIDSIDEVSPKKLIVRATVDGSTKKIKVPLNMLPPSDRADFLAELKKRVGS